MTFDVQLRNNVASNTGITNQGSVLSYAAGEGSGSFLTTGAISDPATVTTTLSLVDKTGTANTHTDTSGNNVVIGEVITYTVVVKVPEGQTIGAVLTDNMPVGMALVAIDSITASPALSFSAGLPSLSVTPSSNGAGASNNSFSLNFGNITNPNTNNAQDELITVVYRAVVRDEIGNQSGTSLTNSVSFAGATDPTLPTFTVVEPDVSISLTASAAQADLGDIITYTLVLTPGGGATPYDVALSDVLPAGLTLTGVPTVSGPAPNSPLSTAGNTLSGNWSQLTAPVTITFNAQVTSALFGQTLNHSANTTWTSLPGAVTNVSTFGSTTQDDERTGASGVGAGLDNYAATDDAPVVVFVPAPELRIVQSSESTSGTRNTYAAAGVTADEAAVGEVVRYRMIVRIPEGSSPSTTIATAIPAGLRYVNDGTTTVALVSDGSFTSSSLSGAGLAQADGGNATTYSSVDGVSPSFVLPSGAITQVGGAAMGAGAQASGTDVQFALGDLTNADNDADGEYIVIEFNAIVANDAANQARDNQTGTASTAATLPVNFTVTSNASSLTSNTVTETVVEPAVVNLTKTVVATTGSVVTYEVTYSNSSTNATAFDVSLVDNFADITGVTYVVGSLSGTPAGSTVNDAGNQLSVSTTSLAPGQSVTLRYQVNVAANTPVPTDAVSLNYTSLSAAGTTLGTTVSADERTGAAGTGADSTINNYADSASSALGTISGRLWDDTITPDNAITTGEAFLGNVTVNLVWAGPDGIFGNADDTLLSTTTDAGGNYLFSALPVGQYRVSTATNLTDPAMGAVKNYLDPDSSGATNNASATITVSSGAAVTNQDFGYIEINSAPTVAVPGAQSVDEDTSIAISGISIADPDPGVASATNFNVVLSASNGRLTVPAFAGVTISGSGTGSVSLTGSIADINAAIAALSYQGNSNYFGSDSISVTVNDRSNRGDADGDLRPGETVQDNLSATASIPITVRPVQDPPVANDDARTTNEDTAITNGASVAGNAFGDVADVDVDGDTITISTVRSTNIAGAPTTTLSGATVIAGQYGTLTIQPNGTWSYVPSINMRATDPAVVDRFEYVVGDGNGNSDNAIIAITITGVNDAPVPRPDERTVNEDTPTLSGNVITAPNNGTPVINDERSDADPDGGPGNRDTLTVQSIQGVTQATAVTSVTAGGTTIAGKYGDLTIRPDGSYDYSPNLLAQTLGAGQTGDDVFNYVVSDGQGGSNQTTLTIHVTGTDDNVNALPDVRSITENTYDPLNPTAPAAAPITGNAVAGNGAGGGQPGDAKDVDVENDPLTVIGVQAGALPTGTQATGNVTPGTLGATGGTAVVGSYGSLFLDGNGNYRYAPDVRMNALAAGQTASDVFTYTITDPNGNRATTTITINLTGANDPITAYPDTNTVQPTIGSTSTGNVIIPVGAGDQRDVDPDTNDVLTIRGVQAGTVATGTNLTTGVAATIPGMYGSLVLQPNGSYVYTIDHTNPTVIALPPGNTLTDVFSYTVGDPANTLSTTTLTITVNGRNELPDSANQTYRINEDTPFALSQTNFVFTDPDTGDQLTNVRIDALPDPARGSLLLNGTPVTAGQILTTAQLSQLSFVPAANDNNTVYASGSDPFFSFSVQDKNGGFDPSPNRITFVVDPVNDAPTAIAPQTRAFDQIAGSQAMDNPTAPGQGLLPNPTDIDNAQSALKIQIDALPTSGTFRLSDGSVVKAGDTLTLTQWQSLRFEPSSSFVALPNAQGLMPGGELKFSAIDPAGLKTPSSLTVLIRPPAAQTPPATVAPVESPVPPRTIVPALAASALGTSLMQSRSEFAERDRFVSERSDVDAGGIFEGYRIASSFGDEVLGPNARMKAVSDSVVEVKNEAPKPVEPVVVEPPQDKARNAKQVQDCDAPKPKAKPKAIARPAQRAVADDASTRKAAPKFSDQVKQAKDALRPPAKPKPKAVETNC